MAVNGSDEGSDCWWLVGGCLGAVLGVEQQLVVVARRLDNGGEQLQQ